MKLFLLILLSLGGSACGFTMPTHPPKPGCVKFVTKRRFEWEAILRSGADPLNKQAIAQALADIDGYTYQAQLRRAEEQLAATSPKNFINPFWWLLEQEVYTLSKEAAAERPPSELDLITVFESCE